jgi:hypothetical protein
MEPEDAEWVQLRVGEELSPPFAVCKTCHRPLGHITTMEFDEDLAFTVQEFDPSKDVEKGLRELGFS